MMNNDLRERAAKKLDEIAQELLKHQVQIKDIGILSGLSGIALFYMIYGRYKKDNRFDAYAFSLIEDVTETIQNGYNFPSLCNGLAGYGWFLEFTVQNRFIEDLDTDDLLEDIDDFLFEAAKLYFASKNIDYLHGGLGIIQYYVKRIQHTRRFHEKLKKYIEESLRLLSSISVKSKRTVKWETLFDLKTQKGGFGICLSHGIASVNVVLSNVIAAGIKVNSPTDLLEKSVNYLMAQVINPQQYTSYFPSYAIESSEDLGSRLAWCYGDLGIAKSLQIAGETLSNHSVLDFSNEVFQHSTSRKKQNQTGVQDSCLCHGSAGLALMYMMESDQVLGGQQAQIVDYWIEYTLNLDTYPDGYAGYKFWAGDKEWLNNLSLLEGITGVGLALLTYLMPKDQLTNWPEILLLQKI